MTKMVSSLKKLFVREVTIPQPDFASCEKLLPYQSNEKVVFTVDHTKFTAPATEREQRKRSSFIKILSLTIAAALTLAYSRSFGRSSPQYAANKYTAFSGHNQVENQVDCPHNQALEPLSYITAEPQNAHPLLHTGWEATCSTFDGIEHSCRYAIEETSGQKFWQSKEVTAGTAHWFAIDLKQKQPVHSVAIAAPRDRKWRKGYIQNHKLEVAAEKDQWETVAIGAWRAWKTNNSATFEPRSVRYIRLTIFDAWDNASSVAIGNVTVWVMNQPSPAAIARGGKWGITVNFPSVPVTAFLDPRNKKLITMASKEPDRFGIPSTDQTVSATWDLETDKVKQEIIDITKHDLFCPGTSLDQNGWAVFTGGSSPDKFTIYSPDNETWFTPEDLTTKKPVVINMTRGYQGQTFLPNGKTFMIGGTWSGGGGNKHGEIYDPATRKWSLLPGINASYIKMDVVAIPNCDPLKRDSKDCVVDAWQQHHAWLFSWKNNSIFHAGPSKQMNWFFPGSAPGERKAAGRRASANLNQTFADGDAVCGVTAMYDAEAGIILTAGGAPNYHYWRDVNNKTHFPEHRNESTKNAFEINIGNVSVGAEVKTKKLEDMHYQRIFANAVILPTGETLVVGGQSQGEPFHDETWQSTPEIYDPVTGHWREMAPHSTPRVYHSWALLMPDASVLVGGSGLSRPESNHYDAQIYYPPYLFKSDDRTLAPRPTIEGLDKQDKVYKAGETTGVPASMPNPE